MERWRHAFSALIVTAIAFACSTGSGGMIGASEEECGSGTEGCRPWNCLCLDGTSTGGSACRAGVCQSGAELCASRCEGHLGVEHYEPEQAVEDSAECAAFCNRIRTQCGADARCNVWFWCRVDEGECEASARDHLACEAETMTVTCTENGWSSSSDCPRRGDELCGGMDGGADGEADTGTDTGADTGTDASDSGADSG